jgi:lipopolysaccharide transport system ATP-binding protein
MSDIAIRVENLSKQYRIGAPQARYKTLRDTMMDVAAAPIERLRRLGQPTPPEETIWALKDVSFEVKGGEVVGIIGRNGAGKTTLLKILSRITEPTEGYAEIYGRVGSLLEVGTGFHPELTGRENIYLNGAILGMKRAEIDSKFDEIVDFAEIEKFLDTPVKRYSSGMYVRLAFAVAAHLEPEILLVDEVLAVGDAAFQKKCLGKMGDVANEGRTVLFVSHNMGAVTQLCLTGLWLDNGGVRSRGSAHSTVSAYLHHGTEHHGELVLPPERKSLSDDFRFLAVRALNHEQKPSDRVEMPRGVDLEVEYEIIRPLRGAQVAFRLWNAEGVCVLSTTDLDCASEAAGLRAPGTYRAACHIGPEWLRPTRYVLDVGASVINVRLLDTLERSLSFEVLDTGGIESRLGQRRWGVVTPMIPWSTELLEKSTPSSGMGRRRSPDAAAG